jgi:peptidoglycan/xylan/chitin deacetylase (PgdA/CDA1 family)
VSSQKKCDGPAVVHAEEKLQVPILLYHYVENVKDKNDTIRQGLNMRPAVFETQLQSLVEHDYKTVFVKNIRDMMKDPMPVCEKFVALTFDDGYEDFYTDVFPLLKKYNAKATAYIIVNFIGRPGFMNEAQIREVIDSGLVEIGSHTMDHYDLTSVSDDVGKYQILESKKELEKRFGISVQSFAYPYGKYVSADLGFVKEASYTTAVTVTEGSIHSLGEEYVLKRVRPHAFVGKDLGYELPLAAK